MVSHMLSYGLTRTHQEAKEVALTWESKKTLLWELSQ
jgi:hypothetical protein